MRVIARILPALLLAPPLLFAAEPAHPYGVAERDLRSHADSDRKRGRGEVAVWKLAEADYLCRCEG